MKGGFILLKHIRKLEAVILRKNGFDDYVKSTVSRHKEYFVVENPKVLRFLENYRESIRIKE